MRQTKQFPISEFKGINLNARDRVELEPTLLRGFSFSRDGALTTDGKLATLSSLTLDDLIGYDHGGLSGWAGSSANGYLWDGASKSSAPYHLDTATFIPKLGLYAAPYSLTDDSPATYTTQRYWFTDHTAPSYYAPTITTPAGGATALPATWRIYWVVRKKIGSWDVIESTGFDPSTGTSSSTDINLAAPTMTDRTMDIYMETEDVVGTYDLFGFRLVASLQSGDTYLLDSDEVAAIAELPVFYSGSLKTAAKMCEVHASRVWYVNGGIGYGPNQQRPWVLNPPPVSDDPRILRWTDTGTANFGLTANYLMCSFIASDAITALASSPAGLLVFGANEALLVRGDPAVSSSFSVQRVSDRVGCDDGVIPARVGGVVFSISHGTLWAINLGMGDVDFGGSVVEVGRPIWEPGFDLTEVVGDAALQRIVVRRTGGDYYSMDLRTRQWSNQKRAAAEPDFLLPSSDYGAILSTVSTAKQYYVDPDTVETSTSTTLSNKVTWTDLTLQSPQTEKLWRWFDVYVGDVDYPGDITVTYSVDNAAEVAAAMTHRGNGQWRFYWPNGTVGYALSQFSLTFEQGPNILSVQPPLIINYVEKQSSRF